MIVIVNVIIMYLLTFFHCIYFDLFAKYLLKLCKVTLLLRLGLCFFSLYLFVLTVRLNDTADNAKYDYGSADQADN